MTMPSADRTAIEPGCSVCTAAVARHGRVETAIGVSHQKRTSYFRCVACATYWGQDERSLRVVGEADVPLDLTSDWRDGDGNLRAAPLPPYRPFARHADLPTEITTTAFGDQEHPPAVIDIPFAHELLNSVPAGPLAERVAVCRQLAQLAEAVSPSLGPAERAWTFRRVEYTDSLGHRHVGFGLELDRVATFDEIASRVRFPGFGPGVFSATPRNATMHESGTVMTIGPGGAIAHPGVPFFNALRLGA